MAYRLPTERRERNNDTATLSYLEHFLEQIETLPSQTKSAFAEIRQLDDKVNTMVASAQTAADEAMTRSSTKGTPIETARRTYHEFIHLQTGAKELADKKLSLATSIYSSTDTVIAELDRRLVEFEAQLKRDGRWPGATPQTPTQPGTPDQSKMNRPLAAKAPRPDSSHPSASQTLNTRAAQKARYREMTNSIPTPAPKARAVPTASSRTNAQSSSVPLSHQESGAPDTEMPSTRLPQEQSIVHTTGNPIKADVEMGTSLERQTEHRSDDDAEKRSIGQTTDNVPAGETPSVREGGDVAGVDDTLYCSCRQVSHGNMIACEGKNCPIEWYHFECVGLTEEPSGMWFCPTCREKEKRRKSGTTRRKYS